MTRTESAVKDAWSVIQAGIVRLRTLLEAFGHRLEPQLQMVARRLRPVRAEVARRLQPVHERLAKAGVVLRPRHWAAIAAVLGLIAVYFARGSAVPLTAADLFEIRPAEFVAKITEPGELRALDSATISAAKDLTIIHLVPEGTYVKKGDLLAR